MTDVFVPFPYTPTVEQLPSERAIIFADEGPHTVYLLSAHLRTNRGQGFTGVWESPTLSKQPQGEELTLRTLGFMYSAEKDTVIEIQTSGSGFELGSSAVPAETKLLTLTATGQNVRRIRQAFNTTGYDLRFRIRFIPDIVVIGDPPLNVDESGIVKIFSYYPSLVQRGRTVL